MSLLLLLILGEGVSHDTASSYTTVLNDGMVDKQRIENDLGGSSHCLIEVLLKHLLGGTEESHEKPQSWPKLKPHTFQMGV
jgi:hypothetical protein